MKHRHIISHMRRIRDLHNIFRSLRTEIAWCDASTMRIAAELAATAYGTSIATEQYQNNQRLMCHIN